MYIQSKDGLIKKDLIAFDSAIFQVLELPNNPPAENQSIKPSSLEALAGQMLKEV